VAIAYPYRIVYVRFIGTHDEYNNIDSAAIYGGNMDIRPIKNEADYEFALKEIEKLFNAQPGTPESDRLDVLVTLVEAYEQTNFPIPVPDDPVEVILYYVESRGLTRKDLENCLGSRSRVSEVLNRKRPLSIEMIRRLHTHLKIPADLLIAAYPVKRGSVVETVGQ
jgi:HTH-type transcriptional regulator/antitoxin HigA